MLFLLFKAHLLSTPYIPPLLQILVCWAFILIPLVIPLQHWRSLVHLSNILNPSVCHGITIKNPTFVGCLLWDGTYHDNRLCSFAHYCFLHLRHLVLVGLGVMLPLCLILLCFLLVENGTASRTKRYIPSLIFLSKKEFE